MSSNKFKQAIDERNKEVVEEKNKESETKKIIEEKNKESEKEIQDNNPKFTISNLFQEEERKAKGKTYYLDKETIELVTKVAKKQKISESKLVNKTLLYVLKNYK